MDQRAYVTINVAALRHNFSLVKQYASSSKVLAVLKADAYGHGAVAVAKHLVDADAFGVTTLAEAMALRNAGMVKPILLMTGVYTAHELTQASQHALSIVVHHEEQLRLLKRAGVMKPVSVWVKINTGMNRLGFALDRLPGVLAQLKELVVVQQPCTLITHFSTADDLDRPETMAQFDRMHQQVKGSGLLCSYGNSAAIMAWPDTHADWVRPGLMLYGLSPFRQDFPNALRPVMSFYARLIAINACAKGAAVGYGGLWSCPEDMLIGIVAVGYADGYPRTASGCKVLIHGQYCDVVGLTSMGMIAVDLRSVPHAKINDRVTLWNETFTLNELATLANVSAYDVLCGINKRVERIVIDEEVRCDE